MLETQPIAKVLQPDAIQTEGNDPVIIRAEWLNFGTAIMGPIVHHERLGPSDRFVVGLPGGSLVEFDFPAHLWRGRRPGQVWPGMPMHLSRMVNQYRALGFLKD